LINRVGANSPNVGRDAPTARARARREGYDPMTPVSCPSCGEKGNIPDHLLGKKIRCQKCSTSFEAGAKLAPRPTLAHAHTHTPTQSPIHPSSPPAVSEAAKSTGDSIEVDGLDAESWASTAVAVAVAVETLVPPQSHHELMPAFTASPHEPEHAEVVVRQYKVLYSKDRWFEGKYEFARLEDALNFYARQGWVVKAMATPHVTGFSGGPREELVVLMER
jgi:Domain of unknown function (DUF4177)